MATACIAVLFMGASLSSPAPAAAQSGDGADPSRIVQVLTDCLALYEIIRFARLKGVALPNADALSEADMADDAELLRTVRQSFADELGLRPFDLRMAENERIFALGRIYFQGEGGVKPTALRGRSLADFADRYAQCRRLAEMGQ